LRPKPGLLLVNAYPNRRRGPGGARRTPPSAWS